jgi:hypothetical protein
LKGGVINTGEVATSGRLVFLRAKSEGVNVDTGVGATCVVLERLDNIEVGTFTLGETVLTVKLELSSDDWVFTPAMHVEGGLSKNECSGIRDIGTLSGGAVFDRTGTSFSSEDIGGSHTSCTGSPLFARVCSTHGSTVLEETTGGDEGVNTRCLGRTTESMDSVGKSINSISVIERLGTKSLVKCLTSF